MQQSSYRVSSHEREAIRTQVDDMLSDGTIQPWKRPWAAPVVLVKKKYGTLRYCVDYRQLNKITKNELYPLSRIAGALDHLGHANYFSSMELKTGYWQIELDERDREETQCITPDGLYEFTVMPFGMCTAPATFQRGMDTVLAGLKWHLPRLSRRRCRISLELQRAPRKVRIGTRGNPNTRINIEA